MTQRCQISGLSVGISYPSASRCPFRAARCPAPVIRSVNTDVRHHSFAELTREHLHNLIAHEPKLRCPRGRIALHIDHGILKARGFSVRGKFGPNKFTPSRHNAGDRHRLFPPTRTNQVRDHAVKRLRIARIFSRGGIAGREFSAVPVRRS